MLGEILLGKMLPQYSARLFKILGPSTSSAMLSDMETSHIASIVRLVGKQKGKHLLELLPDKTSIACRLLLNYSEEAVGAWMLATVPSILDDCNVEDALNRISLETQASDIGSIYVIDRKRIIKGVLSLTSLIRSTANTAVTAVMDKNQESISARTALITVIRNPAWSLKDNLPVTNRNRQLIGVLRYADLRKGLHQISATMDRPDGDDPIASVYECYWKILLILFDTVADITRSKTR
ncbi:MAG: Mg/Co/Ni transporter MgtE [Parasphingorhabdus sp.]|jgi:Mg/Co/Ni transporter MgtE